MADRRYITVSELNFYLNRLIAGEELLQTIPVLGEVSGISYSGNNMYFTFKDDGAQISAVYFGYKKGYLPVDGEEVILIGSPDFYSKGGRLSFIVQKIEPFGKGKLYAELEKLKQKLKDEGLFNEEYKKALPLYPVNVGVVTSVSGAVVHDIVSTVRKYNKSINITVINAAVQGQNAPKSLMDGLLLADKQGFDVIILARGGGSFEDLLPFNDEQVARTVFSLDTPVISAVGHETDYSLTDFTADVRALTPTAAAELIAFDENELKINILNRLQRVCGNVEKKLNYDSAKVISSTKEVSYKCSAKLNALTNRVRLALLNAKSLCGDKLTAYEHSVNALVAKLSALNPASVLQKGYFKLASNGKQIKSVSELSVNEHITAYGADGAFDATITGINPKE